MHPHLAVRPLSPCAHHLGVVPVAMLITRLQRVPDRHIEDPYVNGTRCILLNACCIQTRMRPERLLDCTGFWCAIRIPASGGRPAHPLILRLAPPDVVHLQLSVGSLTTLTGHLRFVPLAVPIARPHLVANTQVRLRYWPALHLCLLQVAFAAASTGCCPHRIADG